MLRSLDDLDRLSEMLLDRERSPAFHAGRRRLSLAPMRRLYAALGHPLDRIAAVHVAGSKGKGSVCLFLESLLRVQGVRTGLYLSPHVDSWLERIKVCGRSLSSVRFLDAMNQVAAVGQRLGLPPPSLFEWLTAAAFVVFERSKVEVAVVEVGIGGRLDATNVIRPEVCVLTAIEREHEAILGRTLCRIAQEKAGIIKPGVHVISGLRKSEQAARVVEDVARQCAAPLSEWGDEIRLKAKGRRFELTLARVPAASFREPEGGSHAARNAALALAALWQLGRRRTDLQIQWRAALLSRGIRQARLKGRAERIGARPVVYRDGAHTPRSIEGIIDWVRRRHPRSRLAVVLGLNRDKRIRECLEGLKGRIGLLVATNVPSSRSLAATELAARARGMGFETRAVDSPRQALRAARTWAGKGGCVLVTGSFWLVGLFKVSRDRLSARLVRRQKPE